LSGGALQRLKRPTVLLALVLAASIGARVFHLDIPTEQRPGQGLIFDEVYYVNAARVIDGIPPAPGDTFSDQFQAGADPNGEHPQLGKLVIAAGIRVFGDNPIGWRMPAVLFGTLALLALYWLVRSVRGSPWLAVAVTALGAVENLWLVTGRIAVLDVFCLPFMLAGIALYVRRRPLLAGVVIGVGACMKELALLAVLVVLALEVLRVLRRVVRRVRWWERDVSLWRQPLLRRALRPVAVVLVTAVTFISVLSVLDATVPPYHDRQPVSEFQSNVCDDIPALGHACNHIVFMSRFATSLRSPNGPSGNTADPWQFWFDVQPIDYYAHNQPVTQDGKVILVNPIVVYLGVINPVILVTAWGGILLTLWFAVRRRDELSLLTVALIAGTWLPIELLSLIDQRTTYLYYMIYTLPALFIGVARLLFVRVIPRWLLGVWIGILLSSFAVLYPYRTLTGA